MKFVLRVLLGLCIVMLAVYAATPLWLPGIIGKQLPDGWQLQQVRTDYPGISGINIQLLQLKGSLPEAELDVSANDIFFSYQQIQTRIGSMSVGVYLPGHPIGGTGARSLDDLSIPLINLSGNYQELSVGDLNLTVHEQLIDSGSTPSFEAAFKQLTLAPRPDEGFHLISEFDYKDIPLGPGWLEINLSADSLEADLQFPAGGGGQKWLTISARQHGLQGEKLTEVRAEIDMDSMTGDWLDQVISKSSGGRFSHASGQLSSSALFSGLEAQHIEKISLDIENLQLVGDGEALDLSSGVSITRDNENIIIELITPVRIQVLDSNRKVDQLLQHQFPEVQRAAHSENNASLALKEGSQITINVDDLMSIHYQGGAILDLQNDIGTIALKSDDFSMHMTEFPKPETVSVEGRFALDWKEQAPVTYKSGTTDFSVDRLSLSTEIVSTDGRLVSQGKSALINGKIDDPSTTVDRIDVQWQGLDLSTLTGNLALQTQGLKSISDGKTWSGFDLNAKTILTNGTLIEGSGKLLVKQGPGLPMEFSGTLVDNRWDISVPVTTIKPDQLKALLKVAQFDLPANLIMSDGYFDLAAKVSVNDEVTATMVINGHGIDVSVKESLADNIGFSFNSQVGDSISGNGPVSIETISLASGFDITQFKSDLTIEQSDGFTLHDLKANLFEGSLSLDELHYTDNQFEETTVKLTGIDLAGLLVFADIDGLNGNGLLNFALPVMQKPAGLTITDGTFQSIGPGFLAYKSGDIAATNIGLQALENFQYKQLTGTINYLPGGTYILTVYLEGANPDLYDGYPIKFNLTINGLLPELFESLFITGDFEEGILKQIQKR